MHWKDHISGRLVEEMEHAQCSETPKAPRRLHHSEGPRRNQREAIGCGGSSHRRNDPGARASHTGKTQKENVWCRRSSLGAPRNYGGRGPQPDIGSPSSIWRCSRLRSLAQIAHLDYLYNYQPYPFVRTLGTPDVAARKTVVLLTIRESRTQRSSKGVRFQEVMQLQKSFSG